eukprot:1159637-Pelagomonas_calceolata.AAC.1
MSASHNPGGPEGDFGIKFNYTSGEPAPESITDKIYGETQKVSTLKMADMPDVDLNKHCHGKWRARGDAPPCACLGLPVASLCLALQIGSSKFGDFELEVIDPVEDYMAQLKEVFDFEALKKFVARKDFKMIFDAMHAVTGPYATRILVQELGAPASTVKDGVSSPDFNGGHPDPNLTYAKELVDIMWGANAPTFGAASDGDGDRNMILGNGFFVTPSDSVAMIAANASCIPYFKGGLK